MRVNPKSIRSREYVLTHSEANALHLKVNAAKSTALVQHIQKDIKA